MEYQIETENLLLRPLSLEYKEDIFREFTAEIAKYMCPQPAKEISETVAFIEKSQNELSAGTDLVVVMLKKNTEEFLGTGGVHKIKTPHPELGVWIKKSAHGRGYGKEAMHALKNWADKNLEYEYIRYPVAKENIASRKIPESLGGKLIREYFGKRSDGEEMLEVEYHIPKQKTG